MLLRITTILTAFALAVQCVLPAFAQTAPHSFPVKRSENAETWLRDGRAAVERAKRTKPNSRKAKNVILFIGDGMGVSTLTAARIFDGQLRGASGEENRLSFEEFPYSALSKTYSVDQQTSDSAPTASAIMTGVKTRNGIISVDQNVVHGDHTTVAGNEAISILHMAEENGRSTGIVSTARLTHATPASTYAHSPVRSWESDADILLRSSAAHEADFPDIARQMVEFKAGDGLDLAFGGGRSKFMPKESADPEYPENYGERVDGRDLTREWTERTADSSYIWNREQFDAIDTKRAGKILGLFEPSHMRYEHDRKNDPAGEPSLTEMTQKAIDILSQNKKGFFLMVEGGRIDHAHHDGNAFNALNETSELSNAVRSAVAKVNLEETLIIVTADHSHAFTMAGYPGRGNNILGLTRNAAGTVSLDRNQKPYTTLGYANGPGHRVGERPELTQEEAVDPKYLQEATIPLLGETHGGEDVAIYAIGPNAYLIRGSMEQNWIFTVMLDAFRFKRKQ